MQAPIMMSTYERGCRPAGCGASALATGSIGPVCADVPVPPAHSAAARNRHRSGRQERPRRSRPAASSAERTRSGQPDRARGVAVHAQRVDRRAADAASRLAWATASAARSAPRRPRSAAPANRRPVRAVREALGHRPEARIPGNLDRDAAGQRHQHQVRIDVAQRSYERRRRLLVPGDAVVERAVRLDVADPTTGRCGEPAQRPNWYRTSASISAGGAPVSRRPKPRGRGRRRARRSRPRANAARTVRAHQQRIAGVEAAGDVRAGDDVEQRLVAARVPIPSPRSALRSIERVSRGQHQMFRAAVALVTRLPRGLGTSDRGRRPRSEHPNADGHKMQSCAYCRRDQRHCWSSATTAPAAAALAAEAFRRRESGTLALHRHRARGADRSARRALDGDLFGAR